MRKLPLYVSLLVACTLWAPAEAQFFGRKTKSTPGQRVPELIVIAKTDADERKRIAAAAELRDYDANTFPEIVSVLADVAKTDARVSVRQEAVESLSRLRPVSQLAGQTLEWSAGQDESWRVRWQAKSALMSYKLSGYDKSPGTAGTGGAANRRPVSTQEPPLIDAPSTPAPAFPQPKLPAVKDTPAARRGTNEAPPGNPPPGNPPGGSLFSRILPGKKPPAAPSAPTGAAKNPAPGLAPPPSAAAPSGGQGFETPPPIVIDEPPLTSPVTPPGAAVKQASPKAAAALPRNVTEPSFRPAGQSPPRPGFTTAAPQRQNVVPSSKQDDDVPILIPPM